MPKSEGIDSKCIVDGNGDKPNSRGNPAETFNLNNPSFNGPTIIQASGPVVQNFYAAPKVKSVESSGATESPRMNVKETDIFISYDWNNKERVYKLRDTLISKKYKIWMDIHRMKGGDSLPAEIEEGITNCKVFLACITPKYTTSDICKKEVGLANARRKRIIPVIFEKSDPWPPSGDMGVHFANLLYVRPEKSADGSDQWTQLLIDLQKLLQK